MRTMKNFAAAALVMLLCTVVFGAMFTSCTNSEDGMPTFTASQKTIKVPVEVRDTVWYPVHDTLTIEVIKKKGLKLTAIQISTSRMKSTILHTIPSLKMV